MKCTIIAILIFSLSITTALTHAQWTEVIPDNQSTPRHENGLTHWGENLFLIGGRGMKPVEEYSIKKNTWIKHSTPPIELHHFTPVSYKGLIYIVTGLTGDYPNETPLTDIHVYDPKKDKWSTFAPVPKDRQRGAAGVTIYKGKIYVVGGIKNGHTSGTTHFADEFDIQTKQWRTLTDAPHIRDHSGLVALNGKLIAVGGRNTSVHHADNFLAFVGAVVEQLDIYDIATDTWQTLPTKLPSPSAGAGVVAYGDELIYVGGEMTHLPSLSTSYAYNVKTRTWRELDRLVHGRHGTNATLIGSKMYIAAGSGNRGGGPELSSIEVLELGSSD